MTHVTNALKAALAAEFVPSSVTASGAAAPQQVVFTGATYNGVTDPILKVGYNADGAVPTEPVIRLGIEGDYKTSATDPNTQWADGLAHHTSEVYFEYQSPDRVSVPAFRPFYLGLVRDDNASQSAIITFDVGTKGFPLSQFNVKAGGTTLLGISAGSFFLGAIPLTMEAVGAQFRSTAAADSAADFFGNGTKQWCWSLKTPNGSGDFIFMDPRNSFRSHVALTGGASNTAALSTFNSSVKVNGNFGINGNTPVGKAGAIASPTSDTVGTKNAIDSIRAALTAVGITA